MRQTLAKRPPRIIAAALAAAMMAAGTAAAQPSGDLADYALFAERSLKTKGLTLTCGDLGVNQPGGKLIAPRFLSVAETAASDIVKLGEDVSIGTLFANLLLGRNVPPATPWTPPILADLAAACGFPAPPPACDPAKPVLVPAGTTTTLAPGTYGDVKVKGGFDPLRAPLPGVLELTGGSYTFCGMKLSRFAEVRFLAPATVFVATTLRMQAGNVWGPAAGSGVTAGDIQVFVAGPKVHYSRTSEVTATLCAPAAKCRLTKGGAHAGAVWCNVVRTEEISFVCAAGAGSPSGAFVD